MQFKPTFILKGKKQATADILADLEVHHTEQKN